jgi:hypothetical protein
MNIVAPQGGWERVRSVEKSLLPVKHRWRPDFNPGTPFSWPRVGCGLSLGLAADELRVAVASNVLIPIKEIARSFEADAGHRVISGHRQSPRRTLRCGSGGGVAGLGSAGRSGRLIRGENIAQAYQFVATGNAGFGFVALSQLLDPERPPVSSVAG